VEQFSPLGQIDDLECPGCGNRSRSRVVDSRGTPKYVRRRRVCATCGARFTTYEQAAPLKEWSVPPLDELTEAQKRALLRAAAAIMIAESTAA
jgi:transcriptional regulator NrdR family protein